MSDERCETCKFWDQYFSFDVGVCLRYPPVFTGTIEDKTSNFDGDYIWSNPRMHKSQWCGEYERYESE